MCRLALGLRKVVPRRDLPQLQVPNWELGDWQVRMQGFSVGDKQPLHFIAGLAFTDTSAVLANTAEKQRRDDKQCVSKGLNYCFWNALRLMHRLTPQLHL